MAAKPFIHFTGNVAQEVKIHKTDSGASVLNFRLLYTPRKPDGAGGFKDGETVAMNVVAWRRLAENAAVTLTKGMAISVSGTLVDDSYTSKEGTRVSRVAIEAESISPDLTLATAEVTRNGRRTA